MEAGERSGPRDPRRRRPSYLGDALEDEPGQEWAEGLREEVRAAWLRALRRLATLRSREGRLDDAQGLFVRLLVADPYDEQVHRMLVRTLGARRPPRRGAPELSGGGGNAGDRRPAPDPAVLRPERAGSPNGAGGRGARDSRVQRPPAF